jgi:hypothetical protein
MRLNKERPTWWPKNKAEASAMSAEYKSSYRKMNGISLAISWGIQAPLLACVLVLIFVAPLPESSAVRYVVAGVLVLFMVMYKRFLALIDSVVSGLSGLPFGDKLEAAFKEDFGVDLYGEYVESCIS